MRRVATAVLALSLAATSACDDDTDVSPAPTGAAPDTPLRSATTATKPGIALVGTAASIALIDSDATYAATLAREFDYVTPENDMKWELIEPQRGQWNWEPADRLVAWARAHDIQVKGHTLVWYMQLPQWIASMTDAAAIEQAMIDHITTEVTHYAGQVRAWDVVNEAVEDGGTGYRDNVFHRALGADYVRLAFETAHTADPHAILNYNDYLTEGRGPKSDFVYAMLSKLVAAGVPVGGVGLQMHVDSLLWHPPPEDVAWNIARLAALGLRVNVSEMDVRVGLVAGDVQAKLYAQRPLYHDLVAACVQTPGCDAVTFWGFTDAHTWIDTAFAPGNYPCLFDATYGKKPAYDGVLAAMRSQ